MKKSLLLIVCALFAMTAMAQVSIGIKGGVTTTELQPSDLKINEDLNLKLKNANYGYHFGLMTQIKLGGFLIQPEFLYNSTSVDFEVDDDIKTERYSHLDIPLMLGVKLGPLRLNAGPVGHVFLGNNSELTDIDGYSDKFKDLTLGYQAGFGLDVGKLMIDLRYEGNFEKFGNHINIGNQQFEFDQSPARLVASVGFRF